MVRFVITPWRTHSCLIQVRDQFYQDHYDEDAIVDDAKRQHAVAKVAVWMQRGNCPHLVESTAVITAAILNDRTDVASYCVRAAYAAAFSRFVTGLLDSHQSARRKLSMYTIAKTLDLPATFVELRHQTIHEELPSLTKLRAASRKALRWIWNYYWCRLPEDGVVKFKEKCARAVRSTLKREKNLTGTAGRELRREYGSDAVLEVLMCGEIHEQNEQEDHEVVKQALQLSNALLDLMECKSDTVEGQDESLKDETDKLSSAEAQSKMPWEEKLIALQDRRAELARMNEELDAERPGNLAAKMTTAEDETETRTTVGKGWAMWEGEWVPKPIGAM